jgi:ribosome-binding ATPase YchF (GTP1/OBG family)
MKSKFYKLNINYYKLSSFYFSNNVTIGILGYPNVGKSTLFNILVKKELAYSANFPFSTITPNICNIGIEDLGMLKLAKIFNKFSLKPYDIKLVDIAGLIKTSSNDEFTLSPAYDCDSFIQVVRCFEDKSIEYVDDCVDPLNEIDIVYTELILSDLNKISKLLKNKDKKLKNNMKNTDVVRLSHLTRYKILETIYQHLNNLDKINKCNNIKNIFNLKRIIYDSIEKEVLNENGVNKINLNNVIDDFLKQTNLLFMKPVFYLLNSNNDNNLNISKVTSLLSSFENKNKEHYYIMSIKNERDLISLCEENINIIDFYDSLEILNKNSNMDSKKSHPYKALHLIENILFKQFNYRKFYTVVGESNIISSFLIKNNSNILLAAEKVHSDFAEKFICAEIFKLEDLVTCGSESKLKLEKKIFKVNKDYIITENDLVIKFYI